MTGTKVAKTEEPGKEIVTLANSDLFVRRDGKGVIRPMSMRITLKKGRDTYRVSGKTHISHLGYQVCNRIANLSIMRPNTIFVDAVERSNPYIERNPITQEAVNIHARSLAIGFAPTGNPVIVDKTVILNLRQYLLTDLKNKIGNFPECGYFGAGDPQDVEPNEWSSKDGKGRVKARPNAVMRFMPTNEITDGVFAGYWFDLAHPEIIALFGQQRTRQQFAERNAISMSSRNAMAEHPCMPLKDVSAFVNPQSGDAVVTVFGFRHESSADDLKGLAQAAADGDLTGAGRMGSEEAQFINAATEPIIVEEAEVEEGIAVEEAQAPEKEKEKTTKRRGKGKKAESEPESESKGGKKEEKPAAEKKSEPTAEKKADEQKEKPAEEKPAEGKKAEKGWGDVYDEKSQGAPPPVDPVTGEIAEEEVRTEEKPEEHEPEPDKEAEKPSEVRTEQEEKKHPISKAHTQLEGAERIMSDPKVINQVAHEIFFAFEEGHEWRNLTEDDKETLLAELIKRTQSGK